MCLWEATVLKKKLLRNGSILCERLTMCAWVGKSAACVPMHTWSAFHKECEIKDCEIKDFW